MAIHNQRTGNEPPPERWDTTRLQPKWHHLSLNVADLDACVAWYTEKLACLGFEEYFRFDPVPGMKDARVVMLKAGSVIIELVEQPNRAANPKTFREYHDVGMQGYGHIKLVVDDAAAVIEILREQGVRVASDYPEPPPPLAIRFFWDLEGNLFGISSGWDAMSELIGQ